MYTVIIIIVELGPKLYFIYENSRRYSSKGYETNLILSNIIMQTGGHVLIHYC
jgi:hypothetical protein